MDMGRAYYLSSILDVRPYMEIILDGPIYADENGYLPKFNSFVTASDGKKYFMSNPSNGIIDGRSYVVDQRYIYCFDENGYFIYNEDGTVNQEASRRVEVKFRLTEEEMIQEMSEILSNE